MEQSRNNKRSIEKTVSVVGRHLQITGRGEVQAVCKLDVIMDRQVEGVVFDVPNQTEIDEEVLAAIRKGVMEAVAVGEPEWWYLRVVIRGVDSHGPETHPAIFQAAARVGFRLATSGNTVIMEPVYSVEVVVAEDVVSRVIGIVAESRGNVESLQTQVDGLVLIHSEMCLEAIGNFVIGLHGIACGKASCSLRLIDYRVVGL